MRLSTQGLSNRKLHAEKVAIAKSLVKQYPRRETFPFKLTCIYHGIPLVFHSYERGFIEEIAQKMPVEWIVESSDESYSIYLFAPDENYENDWHEEVNPNCQLFQIEDAELCIQRDFVGIDHGSGDVSLVCHPHVADGFNNALRWFLPRKLIKCGHVVLHSSCVVGSDGKANIFLGPSGAGKTTVSKLARKRIVLGDDMNILVADQDGSISVEPALLGQSYMHYASLNKGHPLGKFFWLKKSETNSISPMPIGVASLKLVASITNLFFPNDDEMLKQKCLSWASSLAQDYPMYYLNFSLDGGFWNDVDRRTDH